MKMKFVIYQETWQKATGHTNSKGFYGKSNPHFLKRCYIYSRPDFAVFGRGAGQFARYYNEVISIMDTRFKPRVKSS